MEFFEIEEKVVKQTLSRGGGDIAPCCMSGPSKTTSGRGSACGACR